MASELAEQRHDKQGRAGSDHAVSPGHTHSSRRAFSLPPGYLQYYGIQRKTRGAPADDGVEPHAAEVVGRAASSSSQPLPGEIQRQFEGSLGTDLSGVRVHTGTESAAAAESVSAKAYTVGSDIYFGRGQYDPASGEGQRLLAHEVAHTVQQSGRSIGAVQHKLEVSEPGDGLEAEADRAAEAMLTGTPTQVSPGAALVQREAAAGAVDPGAAAAHDSDGDLLDASGLGIEQKEIEGHPLLARALFIQRQPGPPAAAAKKVTATINYQANPPTIDKSKTGAQIGAAHGNPGIVGFTTPKYSLPVKSFKLTKSTIAFDVIIDFTVELASDYTGARGDVLKDHEMGHVTIGNKAGRKFFVEQLKGDLEALPDLKDNAKIKSLLQTAASGFEGEEGAKSKAYDATDYPRMTKAYDGVKTPLADMAKSSPNIQKLVQAMDVFTADKVWVCQMTGHVFKAQAVTQAKTALSTDELAGLQYNPDFKGKVQASKDRIEECRKNNPSPKPEADADLKALAAALDGFTWTPSV